MTGRLRLIAAAGLAAALILAVALASWGLGARGIAADFGALLLPPSPTHPFGTDHMGRDLLARSLHGLALSLRVGLTAAGLSALIAVAVTGLAGLGRRADAVAGFVTDVMLALPHL
ncbi:MAG TPA: ABC transporter permease, partial [Citreicella sp.]|nr:ABC transporter permease [Citreicella sp.]